MTFFPLGLPGASPSGQNLYQKVQIRGRRLPDRTPAEPWAFSGRAPGTPCSPASSSHLQKPTHTAAYEGGRYSKTATSTWLPHRLPHSGLLQAAAS